jgi:tetratricopeptide (TPR) repeat protein
MLGYPEAALAYVEQALKDAREIGHAASLMYALAMTSFVQLLLGNYAVVNAQADELVTVAEEKSAPFWKAWGQLFRGHVSALTGNASDAVHQITSGIAAYRSTGATLGLTAWLSYLMKAHADLRQFDDAWRCSEEAITHIETTKERWWEAEVNRIAGEVALLSPEPDAAKAETYFERALAVARRQQAKSWELRSSRFTQPNPPRGAPQSNAARRLYVCLSAPRNWGRTNKAPLAARCTRSTTRLPFFLVVSKYGYPVRVSQTRELLPSGHHCQKRRSVCR